MSASKVYDALFAQISQLPVIDTHEHLWWNEEDSYRHETDVLQEYLAHYLRSDVVSAGLKPADLQTVLDPRLPIAQRWAVVEPYWEVSRYTGYGRALDLSVRAIYGIDSVRRDTVEALNEAFLRARKPGHFRHVLRDLCNIQTSLLDVWTFRLEGESDLFRRVWQPMNLICLSEPDGRGIIPELEQRHGIQIKTLDDWLEAFEMELDDVLARYDMRVLKCAIAYRRTLRFEEVEHSRAKALFADSLRDWRKASAHEAVMMQFPQELQDYLMHHLMRLAGPRHLTIQFHTGLLEGNGNTLSNSDPSLLTNLFLKYPDVDFDLFHISYPYQGMACALAKMFSNVFVDMCWAHIISPSACVAALHDFLDAIPYNKISGFGGDYLFADGVYGHLLLSRQNVSRVLAEKVEQRVFGEDKALDIARALYYDNPKRIFKL